MNKHVYNVSLVAGWGLVSTGVGLIHLPAGLITAGTLLLGLTIHGARLATAAARREG